MDEAVRLLQADNVVAIPTETVYGLAANAFSDRAVTRIYACKNRPLFNPLIIHFKDLGEIQKIVVCSAYARQLANYFWPGPLTLVLPLQDQVPLSPLCSAGLSTLAVRIPAHPLALKLLERLPFPLAAPSANPSTFLSPTCAEHVITAFKGQVPLLDGGECPKGLESTILDVSGEKPLLLRQGAIPRKALEEVLGMPLLSPLKMEKVPLIKAPGQLLKHYAPSKPLRMNVKTPLPGEGFLTFGPLHPSHSPCLTLSESGNLEEAASTFFKRLHQLDLLPIEGIAVAPLPEEGLGEALNDRLRRASYKAAPS